MNLTIIIKQTKFLGFLFLLLSINFSYAKLVPRGTTTSASVTNATSITIAKPKNVLNGDLLIANLVLYGSYDKINSEQKGWKLVDARPMSLS